MTWFQPRRWSLPRCFSSACFWRSSTGWYSEGWLTFSKSLVSEGNPTAMAMQWYIIHTYSGFEKKVKESLESRVAAFNLQDKIGRVLIPMEDTVEVRSGKKVVSSRMSEAEVDAIINRVHVPTDRPKPKVVFERNEQVRIVDGPFANFNGTVEEIDGDHSRLKVSVTIFGRSTPVELDFASVEKLG